MFFWTKEKLKTAIGDCEFYNMPDDWSACGLRIWHDDFNDKYIALMRGENELRGILPKFLPQLIDNVSAIMTTNKDLYIDSGKPIIELRKDPSEVIINMAEYIRNFFNGKVIDITGSSGKSTTTKILYDLLADYGADSNLGRANTACGISWNMASFDIDSKYWVIETSLGGGIARNSQITLPSYAIITNIAPVHLRANQDITTIATEKSKVFTAMSPCGIAIIYKQMECFDIVYQAALSKGLRVITFGEGDADINIKYGEYNEFTIFGKSYELENCKFPKHIMLDMAAAIAVCYLENLDISKALDILSKFQSLEGRGQTFSGKIAPDKFITVVDEAYNANPLSMKESLQGFNIFAKDKSKVLILGDMLEGGSNIQMQHLELQDVINEIKPSRILFCGTYMKKLWNVLKFNYPGAYYETFDLLQKELMSWLKDDDYIFIKASHSVQLFKAVNLLKAYIKKYSNN